MATGAQALRVRHDFSHANQEIHRGEGPFWTRVRTGKIMINKS
jgi:hypothetical protein